MDSQTPNAASRHPAQAPLSVEIADAFARAKRRARLALLWERVWPLVLPILALAMLFLAFAWSGAPKLLPPYAYLAALALFVVAFLAALWPIRRLRRPSEAEAIARLDAASGLPHRPATALDDQLSAQHDDAVARALWQVHLERVRAAARHLKVGLPSPGMPSRDRFALRYAAALLLAPAWFMAGSEPGRRLVEALDLGAVTQPRDFRIDAWLTPPAYTLKPPVLLAGLRPNEAVREDDVTLPPVPAGTVLTIRAAGLAEMPVTAEGGLVDVAAIEAERAAKAPEPKAGDPKPAAAPAKPVKPGEAVERRFLVNGPGIATVTTPDGAKRVWRLDAIPDKPPAIAYDKDPQRNLRGSLTLTYSLEDDYGVIGADARIASPATGRPLYPMPDFPLSLPQMRVKSGIGQTVKDFSTHPFAGATVKMTLHARDDAGNTAQSQTVEVVLPGRLFTKPVAKSLIELRRLLALDAGARPKVLGALEALMVAPDQFTPEAAVYLGLRTAMQRLRLSRSDDELRGVVDYLWEVATGIEDGTTAEAELALRQAQEALREALERGATDEELKALMDKLRAALDRYLQALAEELRKNPSQNQAQRPPRNQPSRTLRPEDLKNLLDRIEQLARNNQRDAARQMLSELQQLLDNLMAGKPQPGQQPGQPGEGDPLGELGEMMREQRDLMDRTYRQSRPSPGQRSQQPGQRGQPQPGQPGQPGQQPGQPGQQPGDQLGELRRGQEALREGLRRFRERMQQAPGDQRLGEAEDAMRDAEERLGRADPRGAVDAQRRALERLRRGAEDLARDMNPDGDPNQVGEAEVQETDPLGRPLRNPNAPDDRSVRVPGRGETAAERAQRVLEELRRRYSDPARPKLELDYIERLLRGL